MIAAALNAHAAASTKVWASDRSQTVGASEIGQCSRRIYYVKNEGDAVIGASRDADHEDSWGARVRGTVYEDAWFVPALRRQYGDRLLYAGSDQRTFAHGFLSATPDGVLTGLDRDALSGLDVPDIGSDTILIECKTADPRTKLAAPKPEHAYQVQVQLGLVRLQTNFAPEYAVISYTDTSFWNEVKEFPIAFDRSVFSAAEARATQIMTATSASELKPEGWIAGGRECAYCPFTVPCGRARVDRIPEGNKPIIHEAVIGLARTCKDLKADAGAMLNEAKEIELEIRRLLSEAGTRRVEGDGVSVTWSGVKGRPSYDHKKIREAAAAAGVDVESFTTVGEPTDRLLITT